VRTKKKERVVIDHQTILKGFWKMNKKIVILLLLLSFMLSACLGTPFNKQVIKGSGNLTSETRNVSGFSAVSLAGSGNVEVAFGPNETVIVEAEDNILPVIETVVEKGVLVIRTKPNYNIQATKPIQIYITMKSLDGVSISGSGNITVSDLNTNSFSVAMPGSGNITVGGTANNVNIALAGSGNILCENLKAKDATVTLNGSGNITVNASESLDASIKGSGDIHYSGNPTTVNKSVAGSGSIHE
jgi:hypothetical protein